MTSEAGFNCLKTHIISSLLSLLYVCGSKYELSASMPPAGSALPLRSLTLWKNKPKQIKGDFVMVFYHSQQKMSLYLLMASSNKLHTANSTWDPTPLSSTYSIFVSVSKAGFELEVVFLPQPPKC